MGTSPPTVSSPASVPPTELKKPLCYPAQWPPPPFQASDLMARQAGEGGGGKKIIEEFTEDYLGG